MGFLEYCRELLNRMVRPTDQKVKEIVQDALIINSSQNVASQDRRTTNRVKKAVIRVGEKVDLCSAHFSGVEAKEAATSMLPDVQTVTEIESQDIGGIHDNFRITLKLNSGKNETWYLKSIGDDRAIWSWFTSTVEYRNFHDVIFQNLNTQHLLMPSSVRMRYDKKLGAVLVLSRDIAEHSCQSESGAVHNPEIPSTSGQGDLQNGHLFDKNFEFGSKLVSKLLNNSTLTDAEKEEFKTLDKHSLAEALMYMYLLNIDDLKAENISSLKITNPDGTATLRAVIIDSCYRQHDRVLSILNCARTKPRHINYNISFNKFIEQFVKIKDLLPENELEKLLVDVAPEVLNGFIQQWDSNLKNNFEKLSGDGLPAKSLRKLQLDALRARDRIIAKTGELLFWLKEKEASRAFQVGAQAIPESTDTGNEENQASALVQEYEDSWSAVPETNNADVLLKTSKDYLEDLDSQGNIFDIRHLRTKFVNDKISLECQSSAKYWFAAVAAMWVVGATLLAINFTVFGGIVMLTVASSILALGCFLLPKALCEIDMGLQLHDNRKVATNLQQDTTVTGAGAGLTRQ